MLLEFPKENYNEDVSLVFNFVNKFVHTLYICCREIVQKLYIRCTYVVHTLYIRCTYDVQFAALICFKTLMSSKIIKNMFFNPSSN